MVKGETSRGGWAVCLIGIIAMGILSRVIHTGLVVFDKYLGDALYAAMVYAILRLFWRRPKAAVGSTIAMVAIEFFQMTLIPVRLLGNEHWIVRIGGRLMG